MDGLIETLSALSSTAFRWSALAFLALNGLAALAVWRTRDRRLVNRWTSPLLAANLILLGTGAGLPVLAILLKSVVQVVAATVAPGAAPPLE
jgi:hypothetical protein